MTRPPLFMCFSAACVARNITADVDVDHAIHLFQRCLLERFRNGSSGIVYKDVEAAEGRNGLFDRRFAGVGISGVPPESRSPFRRRVQSLLITRRGRSLAPFVYVTATFAPSAARRLAIAAPMPREPPVMSAIFPSSFLVIVFLLCVSLCIDWYTTSAPGQSLSSDLFTHRYEIRSCCSTARTAARL